MISTVGDVSWLMTVVSKADLWWNDQETVLNHYNSGSYAKAIEVTGLPSQVVVPYSSVFHQFYDEVPLAGSFDDKERALLRRNLFDRILEAIGQVGKSR